MSDEKREKILGIDLGTTNSAAAVVLGGNPTIIPSAEGPTVAGKMFPSVVAFTKDGQLLVGEPARRQAVTNPEGTVREVKRLMGSERKVTLQGKEYNSSDSWEARGRSPSKERSIILNRFPPSYFKRF